MNLKKWIEFRWCLEDIKRAYMATQEDNGGNDGNT